MRRPRPAFAPRRVLLLAALLTAGCTPTTQPPPAEPPSAAAVFGMGAPVPGTRVYIGRGGQWLPGTIVQVLGGDRFVVNYDGSGPEWNEAVGLDRLQPPSNGASPLLARDYQVGEKVLVIAQNNKMLLADVVQKLGLAAWRVHYDGYGPEVAEDVGPERMRRPYTGPSAHPVSEAVLVDVDGQALPARVVAASAPDRWVVRFDGYGPQYDQEIDAGRLHASAPAAVPAALSPAPSSPAPSDATPSAAPAPAGAPPLIAGAAVLVQERGGLFPATLVSIDEPGRYKVRFERDGGEEVVAPGRVTRAPEPLKGGKYARDQAVLVEWHGMFVPGKVVKASGSGQYRVRFEGMGPESDEILPARRLRPRP